jgi:periplasmic protein TonB
VLSRLRFPISFAVGVLVSGGLFWFLHTLITRRPDAIEQLKTQKIEFTRLRRDTEVQAKKREKAELDKPKELPPQANISKSTLDLGGEGIAVIAPTIESKANVRANVSLGAGGTDRDTIPLVRIDPDYPMKARQNGTEGWVVLRFTITPAGTTKDVTVVQAQPSGVFDEAAIRAVSRYKYNPKIEGGVAVERPGIMLRLDFKLNK